MCGGKYIRLCEKTIRTFTEWNLLYRESEQVDKLMVQVLLLSCMGSTVNVIQNKVDDEIKDFIRGK